MGNEQPKKINKVTKAQIDMGALKAKIHLELMRDRKNAEVIKGEKQLVMKIKAKNRNKSQELLIAERVVNGLKYAQACNQLMAYAVSIRAQANFLAENINNPEKLAPWLPQIYSLLYAADMLGLSSLKQFKDLMRALNDPTAVQKYINPQIIELLKPSPSPEQLNIYMLEFSERNNIALEEINLAGHKFSKDFHPTNPAIKEDSFADLERKLAEEMNNKMNIGAGGWGPGGQGQTGGITGPGGFVPGSNPQVPNYYNLDKGNPGSKPSQFSNPYGIRQSFDPRSNQNKLGTTDPTLPSNPSSNPNNPSNMPIPGPNLYTPTNIPSNPQSKPIQFTQSRISIKSIDEIDYFPEIEPAKTVADPEFDKICEILRAAM